jgi:hypothetical protein
LTCFLENLALICKAPVDQDGTGGTDAIPAPNPQQNADACKDAFKSFQTCAEKNHLTGDMTMMMDPPANNTCQSSVGCDGCRDAFSKCVCEAGSDLQRLSMCMP